MIFRILNLFFISLILLACTKSPSDNKDIKKLLIGQWQEETIVNNNIIKNIITINADGKFKEIEYLNQYDFSKKNTYEGEWSFDGVNFKRKYMKKNEKILSNANYMYTTLALKENGENKFLGIDNINRTESNFTKFQS